MTTAPERQSRPGLAPRPAAAKRGPEHSILALQRAVGNSAVGRLLEERAGAQRKPVIGQPGDRYEKEAESVAQKVVSGQTVPPVSTIAPGSMTQRQEKEDEKVQKAAEERRKDEPVQKEEKKKPEEKPVQRAAAERAISGKGGGEPLATNTRSVLEDRMGADLGGVRVHNDSAAKRSAAGLDARAFTHGNEIWLGQGESQDDVGLMAHEATHVVQQRGAVQRQVVQRGPKNKQETETKPAKALENKAKNKKDEFSNEAVGSINMQSSKAKLSELRVPDFKEEHTKAGAVRLKVTDPTEPEGRKDKQRSDWDKAARKGEGLSKKLKDKLKGEKPETSHYLSPLNAQGTYIIGTENEILTKSLRPFWDAKGNSASYQVDHKHEVQLGGSEETVENLWLLDSTANQSCGPKIYNAANAQIKRLWDAAAASGLTLGKLVGKKDYQAVRTEYEITAEKVVGGLEINGTPDRRWELKGEDGIMDGKQIDALKVVTGAKKADLKGSEKKLAIYTSETGGGVLFVEVEKTGKIKPLPIGNFTLDSVSHTKGKGGKVSGTTKKSKTLKPASITNLELLKTAAVDFGGVISNASLRKAARDQFKADGASPIIMDEVELDPHKGIVGRGKLLPTIPLLARADIDIVIDGEDIYLSKTFDIGELSVPGPIKVTDSSLTVNAGTQGIEVIGDLFFSVERLGHGNLRGLGSTATGFGLEGKFELESDLFSPAEIEVWYRKEKVGGKGTLGLKPGKVKGVKSATIDVSVDGETWAAKGSVEPAIRGVEKADLAVNYSPASGIEASGTLQLAKDNPLVKGGSVEASLRQRAEGEGYVVKAHGTATLGFSGITATVDVDYDDGAFTAQGTVPFEKGMLQGTITAGLTNRGIGADGLPAAGPPGDKTTPFGAGTATIKITPWLQGTAGIRLRPNGEIEISGKISLPAALDVFSEKKLDKNIFSIDLDIPLFGVAVLGQRIGIFATVGGGLDATAGIGPGQLRDLSLEIAYNPSREKDTQVKGSARFHVPGHAGLRLSVHGAIGAGIPVVSAKAGLEVGGKLGIEGAAEAAVQVDWTPAKGLSLDAQGKISAEPKFQFDVSAFVDVTADLLFSKIELYKKSWQLAAFEYGSGLRFGIIFPIRYREGKPFDVSLSDVQFEMPKVDAGGLLEGLVKHIVG